jgi:hypothetical protein
MTDGLGPWTAVAAIIRGIFGVAAKHSPQPKLKLWVNGNRLNGILYVYMRVTNEGGAAVTIDHISSWVRADRGNQNITEVIFKSGPKPPFRLESFSSARWEAKFEVKRHPWMAGHNVDCTGFVSGGGVDAYRRKKVAEIRSSPP